jgi:tyrosyl-tRNA synthetase
VGGATGRIGDPSGRTKERDKQDLETVRTNVTSIQQCIQRVFKNHQKYFWKEEKDQLLPIK